MRDPREQDPFEVGENSLERLADRAPASLGNLQPVIDALVSTIETASADFDDAYWLKKDREGGFPFDFFDAMAANGWLADWSGLHYMVGAFLAGAALDAKWFGTEAIDRFRDVVLLAFMPVFFLSTGLRTTWSFEGRIVYKRAYCDWGRYREDVTEFHRSGVELIDIPQRRYTGKNYEGWLAKIADWAQDESSGYAIPKELEDYGWNAKKVIYKPQQALDVAERTGVQVVEITGKRGTIGAVAAIGCFDLGLKAAGLPEDFES